jgi:signal transduction histidine kinase
MPMIEPLAVSKRLELRASTCPSDVVCRADRTKVEQILLNLLSNAVKFTDGGGSITVSCGLAGDRAWMTVRDTGCGIPADKLESVFEPFVQLGRSLTTAHEGTGLGLSISRDMARGMGGELSVESQTNVGSAFTLSLPSAE